MSETLPRVFLGLTEVAGYYGRLAEGLRALGARATFVDLSEHPFGYGRGHPTRLAAWTAAVFARRRAAVARGHTGVLWLALEVPLRAALLCWAAAHFDVFVFGFGVTFLGRPAVELPLLRRLGKRIIVICHGSDSRPPYLDGSVMARDRGRSVEDCVRLTRETKRRVLHIDRWAHVVVDNPLSAHFHERRCVQWLALGIPSPGPAVLQEGTSGTSSGDAVRVLHSPSHPEAKGTARIRAAVRALQGRGLPIDYVEITGRPHQDVLAELARCDLVVDQLYSDTPMAGFAAEAAAFGKAAVVGSYGAAEFERAIPGALMPPVLLCAPDAIEEALAHLVVDRQAREQLGTAAAQFVRSCWAPAAVAERLLQLVGGRIPDAWTFDPGGIRYVAGCCLPLSRVRELVQAVIDAAGVAALQLDDKPGVLAALEVLHADSSVEERCSAAC